MRILESFFKKSMAYTLVLVLVMAAVMRVAPAAAAGNTVEIKFNSSDMASNTYFSSRHNINVSYNSSENAVQLSTTGADDPYVTFNVSRTASISADTYKYIVIKYRVPKGTNTLAGETQLFWSVGGQGVAEERSTRFSAERSDTYVSKIIDTSQASYWKGNLSSVRIDPFANGLLAGNNLFISSMSFCTTRVEAEQLASGVDNSVVETTPYGLKYTASGHTGYEPRNYFIFSNGLLTQFDASVFPSAFNRMTFRYTSNQPLKMTAVYTERGRTVTDLFYLNAGADKEFSALIKSYLDGATATKIERLNFESCNGAPTIFYLSDINTERVAVHNDALYFLQNSRYKVGIKLNRGGGISHIQDLTKSISGLTNLINNHDTGRLVQQSYYGTASGSQYTGGTYNGQAWNYNPVQGGDQYNNASRLIDLSISGDSVYIKAQPQDWSHNNHITPSYMENVYTLHDDYIQVDNVFTDYSGYDNPVCDQEMPAFYTVSYLNTFTRYAGNRPWTGGALTSESDLPFWGDGANAARTRFNYSAAQTETWCAWTSSESNFGIGVYTPNITQLLAGRYNYNGSKSASNDATNYVAPLQRFKIVSYQPKAYTYYIATGSVNEIRTTFTNCRNTPAPVKYTVSFNSNGGSTVVAQSVESGKTAVKPADPSKKCSAFGGWYTDAACTNAYNFNSPVTGNLMLYAKWTDSHTLIHRSAVAATCTKTGSKAYYECSVCGKWFEDAAGTKQITDISSVVIPKTAHRHGDTEFENEVAATCEKEGSRDEVIRCADCNEVLSRKTVTIPKTAHKLSHKAAVAATCVKEGAKEYYECADCHKWFEDANGVTEITDHNSIVIPKTAHRHGDTEFENEVAATCEKEGSRDEVIRCADCNEELSRKTVTIPKTAHKLSHKAAVAATCIKEGVKEYYECADCHKWFEDADGIKEITDHSSIVIPKTAHRHGDTEFENEVAATCEKEGSRDEVVRCADCNEVLSRKTVTVPPSAHTLSHKDAVAATCTKTGTKEYYECSVCGKWFEDAAGTKEITDHNSVVISKTAHTHGTAIHENEVAATCTKEGSYDEVVRCTVCNEEISRKTVIIQKAAHTPGAAVRENEVAATETQSGSYDEVTYCTVCKQELGRKAITVPPISQGGNENATAVIKKVLRTGEGTEIPASTFTFTFTQEQNVTTDAEGQPLQTRNESVPISSVTISMAENEAGTEDAVNRVKTVEKQSGNFLPNASAFPKAGVYVYKVTETGTDFKNTDTDNLKETMTLSQAEYRIYIYVANGNNQELYIKDVSAVYTKNDDGSTNGENIGKKVDDVRFVNDFERIKKQDPNDPAVKGLEIKKMVDGEYTNMTQAFDFSVTLKKPAVSKAPSVVGTVYNGNTATDTTYTFTFNDEGIAVVNNIKLAHGQKLAFSDVPVGTHFRALETLPANENWSRPTIAVKAGGVDVAGTASSGGADSGEQKVGENFENSVTVTNKQPGIVETGIKFMSSPFFIMIALSMAAFIILLVVKVKRAAE